MGLTFFIQSNTLRTLMVSFSPFTFRVIIERHEFSVIIWPIDSLFFGFFLDHWLSFTGSTLILLADPVWWSHILSVSSYPGRSLSLLLCWMRALLDKVFLAVCSSHLVPCLYHASPFWPAKSLWRGLLWIWYFSPYKLRISCGQQMDVSHFFIQSETLRLLMGSFSPFMFRVTIERYEISVIVIPIQSLLFGLFLWVSYLFYRVSLNISCRAGLVVTYSFSSCVSWKLFISPSILNERAFVEKVFLAACSSHLGPWIYPASPFWPARSLWRGLLLVWYFSPCKLGISCLLLF